MSIIVHISESAFLSILFSTIESYPSKFQGGRKPKGTFPEGEVYGLLFGQKMDKNNNAIYNINIAIPMQILEIKSSNEITPSIKHFDRIKSVVETYPMFQFLGTFHSHPEKLNDFREKTSAIYSEVDEKSAIEDSIIYKQELLEIIIAVTYLKKVLKTKKPKYCENMIINYLKNYKYIIAAYVTNSKENEFNCVDNLICPMAVGIGNFDLNYIC
jgi:hypothetical protein